MSPEICVIVPCRNEAADIAGCIEAIARQDLPKSAFEVILVDGESVDDTVALASAAAHAQKLRFTVLTNPDRTAATALNLGLAHTGSEFIVRVDARSRIGKSHLSRCRDHLKTPSIGVVGGGQRPVARLGAGLEQRAIVRSLSNRYTTGLARYRRSTRSGATDTVWMGAFRRADLIAVGGWPLHPAQNQDYMLNQTLRGLGLQAWFDPELTAGYLPRQTFRELAHQYRAFGRAKGTIWRDGGSFGARHALILMGPVVSGLVLVGMWRNRGPACAVLISGTILLAADEIGGPGPAPLADRVASVAATVVADGAWLAGVVEAFICQ